jgi:HEAT repeat protein
VDDLEPEAAADVVRWLGTRKHRVAQRAVVRAMTDERQEVRAAAFETAPNLPVPRILPALARVLSDDDEDRASEPLASLDRLGGEQVSATVSGLVPEVRPRVAVGLLEFLAKRGAVDQVEAVYAQTFATEKGVRAAAFAALPAVVTAGDVTRLLERLLQADDDRAVSGLQAALVAAARQIPDEQVRTADMVAAFATAGGKEKVRLLAVLAALKGRRR